MMLSVAHSFKWPLSQSKRLPEFQGYHIYLRFISPVVEPLNYARSPSLSVFKPKALSLVTWTDSWCLTNLAWSCSPLCTTMSSKGQNE